MYVRDLMEALQRFDPQKKVLFSIKLYDKDAEEHYTESATECDLKPAISDPVIVVYAD